MSQCDDRDLELEFLESLNTLLALREQENVSLCLTMNRECFFSEQLLSLYRDSKLSGTFGCIFETVRNQAGYSKDVHGQLNLTQGNSCQSVRYRLQENRVDLFQHFNI
jgi:hypothetical protein